jgi:small subunit ribosomal protein S18
VTERENEAATEDKIEPATAVSDAPTDDAAAPARPPVGRPDGARFEGPRGAPRGEGDEERPRRRMGRRRRVCIMCADKIKVVDYKNVSFLRRFISDRARIETRRKTSACAKHQRALSSAIKRARHLALLPYTAEHLRGAGMGHR